MLLLKSPTMTLPPEREVSVAGGGIETFSVSCGQLLTITDMEGGQPAALFAVSASDPDHMVSPHHTRVFSNSFILRLGMRLVTNRRRPAMVLGQDTVGSHDLLMPITEASTSTTYEGSADRFRDKLRSAFARSRVALKRVPDPINLFLDVAVNPDGTLAPRGVASKGGGAVTFRIVMDLIVGVAAPFADERLWRKPAPSALAIHVHNRLG